MGLFRHLKNWKQFYLRNFNSHKPVNFEILERRIMLSGDSLSTISTDLVQPVVSDNNLQIAENYISADLNTDETVINNDNLTSDATIEQNAIVLSQSNLIESGDMLLDNQGLQFNLIPAEGMSQQVTDAFQQAADLLSAMFSDNIIVNIEIDFKAMPSGILGSSSFTMQTKTYSQVLNALINDQTSVNDSIAINNLPTGSYLDIFIKSYQ